MDIKLETVKKGDIPSRSQSFEQGLAEKVLRKSKNWRLPEDSKYVFKDNSLILKASKKKNS